MDQPMDIDETIISEEATIVDEAVIRTIPHATFSNVTNLVVSFEALHLRLETLTALRPIVKDFFSNINHARQLKSLRLEAAAIDLGDMEILHDSLPHINKLELINTSLFSDYTRYMQISQDMESMRTFHGLDIATNKASNIKHLKVLVLTNSPSMYHNMDHIKVHILKWLVYISIKYNGLLKLSIETTEFNLTPCIDDFKGPILNIIRNTPYLTSFAIDLIPITETFVQIVDLYDRNLKELTIYTDGYKVFRPQLDCMKSSTQFKSLEKLIINSYTPNRKMSRCIITSEGYFNHLVSLEINDNTVRYSVLTSALKVLHTLENLSIDRIIIQELFKSLKNKPTTQGSLKNLKIGFRVKPHVVVNQKHINHANEILEYALNVCPRLETFEMRGDLHCDSPSSSALSLFFDYHDHLKSIAIDFGGIYYYTFPWTPEKREGQWMNHEHRSMNTFINQFHLVIGYKKRNGINIKLKNAPVRVDLAC